MEHRLPVTWNHFITLGLTVKCQLYFLFYQANLSFLIWGWSFLTSPQWFITFFLKKHSRSNTIWKCVLATHRKEQETLTFPGGGFGQISWSDHTNVLGIKSRKVWEKLTRNLAFKYNDSVWNFKNKHNANPIFIQWSIKKVSFGVHSTYFNTRWYTFKIKGLTYTCIQRFRL
jgi:hypothetical protein